MTTNSEIWHLPMAVGQESKAHVPLETGFALPNTNEINKKSTKCTWPTQAPTQGNPTQPIFHWLALGAPGFALGAPGFALGPQGFALGAQGFWIPTCIGIPNAKWSRWGSNPMRRPNASVFTSRWNIGLRRWKRAIN